MLVPTLLMVLLAAGLLALAWQRGDGSHLAGLRAAAHMTLQLTPLLLAAFLVAGLLQSLLPADMVQRWLGESSGFKGILLASLVGGLTPGGPYVSLPVAMVLVRAGAGAGVIVAFLSGWSLWAFNRIPLEIGILGWRLTVIRLASVLVFPPIIGLVAHIFFKAARQG